jgi:hypothetical protein
MRLIHIFGKAIFNEEQTERSLCCYQNQSISGDKGDIFDFEIDTNSNFDGVLKCPLLMSDDDIIDISYQILFESDSNGDNLFHTIEVTHFKEMIPSKTLELTSEHSKANVQKYADAEKTLTAEMQLRQDENCILSEVGLLHRNGQYFENIRLLPIFQNDKGEEFILYVPHTYFELERLYYGLENKYVVYDKEMFRNDVSVEFECVFLNKEVLEKCGLDIIGDNLTVESFERLLFYIDKSFLNSLSNTIGCFTDLERVYTDGCGRFMLYKV